MKSNTHLLGGVAAAALYKTATDLPPDTLYHELTYFGAAVLGSLLPDLCHPGSYLGKKTSFLSKTISKTFGHRTITHSWIMILLVMMLPNWMDCMYEESLSSGLTVGVTSHIILDAATSRGVQLFYPLPIRFRFPLYTKTGTKTENNIATIISLIAAVLMIHIYIVSLF
ncbi:metal-dependent hydrolase [Fictibacillus phosphorivorans]|uniref:metal-dependent hydrolase n=1 Tax=Fictibacillus phosphorivorans TaxID=1221500 RepID=UPI00203CF036|nr:metal-dependent hydrolase [Fictibacillus phosphorivorans]MCM3718859.1 metal-dependent hydrolase [Fictibacillus phosphorivorans]MCM3776481.1 metal-dependent hydrolase [Fictibacillus phosphorivorans]